MSSKDLLNNIKIIPYYSFYLLDIENQKEFVDRFWCAREQLGDKVIPYTYVLK